MRKRVMARGRDRKRGKTEMECRERERKVTLERKGE